nr:immunoglobulin light chain junction region [Macaca mulatta]MOX71720.1 immunoglobulin light chain junction region [Macaca mulatta]MOX71896.1 immunoglobulin light chain junction region [Macaca mulatta]MOX76064.1 immunoglobulin light chain junction region [Macaca mulatta]MOX76099.1 immunoglobulin light chain junction region [Macaca mulatta]
DYYCLIWHNNVNWVF